MLITADDQIRGCTVLIESKRSKPDQKATAFYNRGNAHVGRNDFARAITDYTDAISLRANYAEAYFNRAVAYRVSGDPKAAVTDYSTAITLALRTQTLSQGGARRTRS